MWLFTTDGFYSVVEHRDKPGTLLVRAREREHLVKFRIAARRFGSVVRIEHTPTADYPFRCMLPRANFARMLAEHFAARITYPNFKDAAHDAYAQIDLFDVWCAAQPKR